MTCTFLKNGKAFRVYKDITLLRRAERQHTRGVLLILGSNEILLDKMQEKLNDMMRRDDELDKDEAMKKREIGKFGKIQ